jgi:hypothetical protein
MDAHDVTIALHSRVTVELVDASGEAERGEFTIVTARQADLKSGLLDENTPLAQALLGHVSGDVVPYGLGDLKEVRILAVESGAANVSPEAAQKRREAVRQAAAQSEITSQMIFATASGSKWGDYDVDVDKLIKDDARKDKPVDEG